MSILLRVPVVATALLLLQACCRPTTNMLKPPPSTSTSTNDDNNDGPSPASSTSLLLFPFVHASIAAVLMAPSNKAMTRPDYNTVNDDDLDNKDDREEEEDSGQKRTTKRRIAFTLDDDGRLCGLHRCRCSDKKDAQQGDDDDDDAVSSNDLVALAVDAHNVLVVLRHGSRCCRFDHPVLESLLALARPANNDYVDDGGEKRQDSRPQTPRSCLLALLIALNYLESAIRDRAASSSTTSIIATGKSPLLKDMLVAMGGSDNNNNNNNNKTKNSTTTTTTEMVLLANVCRALLLPTGLNLRNLAWHGFLGESGAVVLRLWLSLTVLLVDMILRMMGSTITVHYCPPTATTSSIASSSPSSKVVATTTTTIRSTTTTAHRTARTSPLLRNTAFVSERCYCQLEWVLDQGKSIRKKICRVDDVAVEWSYLVPPTHQPLLCLVRTLLRHSCPALAATLLVVLLEHVLRLQWCRANGRPDDDAMATTGRYYVTLDGHGQRSKHDVMLHYDCGPTTTTTTTSATGCCCNENKLDDDDDDAKNSTKQNQLCHVLGGSTMALLTDLFISGCGGPNLRAALAHGLYDEALAAELRALLQQQTTMPAPTTTTAEKAEASLSSSLFDLSDVLLLAFDRVAVSCCCDNATGEGTDGDWTYVPAFSFAACIADAVNEGLAALVTLKQLMLLESGQPVDTPALLPEIDLYRLKERFDIVVNISKYRLIETSWTVADMYEESSINANLVSLTAARALLIDVLEAVNSFLVAASDPQAMERRRMKVRAFHLFRLSWFALYVALSNMEYAADGDGKKVVERTRMVVSTYSTFVFKNDERSFKAIETFAKAKLVKKSISDSQTRFGCCEVES